MACGSSSRACPPNAGVLAGLTAENLRDWRGEGTTVPPRLEVSTTDMGRYPLVQWCGFTAPRPWRCGCQGTVATVLIEKPTSGDFLPLLDGGFGDAVFPALCNTARAPAWCCSANWT